MAEKEAKKPVMDVEKPGTTPASATSRPLIISKGPAIKDPMVTATDAEAETEAPVQPLTPTKKKTIQPLTEQPKQELESENEPAAKAETSHENEELAPDLVSDEGVEETDASEAEQQLSEAEEKRRQLVDKLVVEKKYFVPIGAVQKKRAARNSMLLFAVFILAVAGGALAIDAELVETGITLPFDLIKN